MALMRAVLYNGPEGGISIEDVPIPKPRAGDLLVKIKSAGLCHSDFALLEGTSLGMTYPTIPGHEGGYLNPFHELDDSIRLLF